mgnify:FL=1
MTGRTSTLRSSATSTWPGGTASSTNGIELMMPARARTVELDGAARSDWISAGSVSGRPVSSRARCSAVRATLSVGSETVPARWYLPGCVGSKPGRLIRRPYLCVCVVDVDVRGEAPPGAEPRSEAGPAAAAGGDDEAARSGGDSLP